MKIFNKKLVVNRINEYTKAVESERLPIHQNEENWKELLLEGRVPFVGYGENYQVDFKNIDFTGPEVNHQEWRAQLNRFFWLNACMKEDLLTDSDYFARVAKDTVESFLSFRKNVKIMDGNELWEKLGDNTLSASSRLGKRKGIGWWGTLPFMRESVIDTEFLIKVYESTMAQIKYIMENLTPCGNWRISELSCLLFIGYIFDEEEIVAKASRNLNETFRNQVAQDGCHEEQTIGYHSWMAREFTSFYLLSVKKPEIGLKIDPVKLVKMWDYVLLSSTPDKQHGGLNDAQRWGCIHTEKTKNAYDFAVKIRSYLVNEKGIKAQNINREKSSYFESAGHWFIKHNEKNDNQMLIFDATRHGGGHCHMGVNSINFYYGNKMMLIDPGTFSYEKSNIFTRYGRHTISHNTVSVDGMEQLPSTINEALYHLGEKCALVNNIYSNGYEEKDESVIGLHERLVLWKKDSFILVNDIIKSQGKTFTANFNFLPGEKELKNDCLYTKNKDYNIMIMPVYSNCDLSLKLYEGSMQPMAGWLAKDGYTQKGEEKGSSLHISGNIHDEGSVAAYVIIPFKGEDIPHVQLINRDEIERAETKDRNSRIYNGAIHYKIKTDTAEYGMVSSLLNYRDSRLYPSIGQTGDYESDGKLALVEFKEGKVVFAYLYDGTYLKYREEFLVNKDKAGNYEKVF